MVVGWQLLEATYYRVAALIVNRIFRILKAPMSEAPNNRQLSTDNKLYKL